VISFEVERLTKLTSDLLSLNQYEQGKHKLNITSFDINKTIKQTAASFEGTCIEKHIKLQLIFSEEYTMVNADYAKIQQVLYNLLDNAIKFSHNDSKIIIKSIEKKEKVQISIKDFGIGIPKEGIKQIWDRFYKTDISRGKDKKGTGLGLSIVKEILKSHDENINVTSTEGAGTEFTFTLPLSSPHE
ncbi:MAG: HAMP domain-containing histidine kinase, partial [Lachnospiraceae bacterium]|nr:HAMP domain-containing histidine kinase [Lachnospiraceae bacterium]